VWPSAARAWDLVNGVKMGDTLSTNPNETRYIDRPKRPADAAFGEEKTSDYLQREAFKDSSIRNSACVDAGVQVMGNRIMAHMLGLNVPGIEPSTSYYPGYEWWPRTAGGQTSPTPSHQPVSLQTGAMNQTIPRGTGNLGGLGDWSAQPSTPSATHTPVNYGYDHLSSYGGYVS
jgi:hypothetical protein